MTARKTTIAPLVAIFLVLGGGLTATRSLLARWGIDYNVLIIANVLFFLIGLLAFFMQQKALANRNPNVFIRSVMGGMLMRMFVCIAAIIVYWLVARNSVNKLSVFAAMILYLLYLGVEVAVITKLNKTKK